MFLDYFKSILGQFAPLYLRRQEVAGADNEMTANHQRENSYSNHDSESSSLPGADLQANITLDYNDDDQDYDLNTVTLKLQPSKDGNYEIVFEGIEPNSKGFTHKYQTALENITHHQNENSQNLIGDVQNLNTTSTFPINDIFDVRMQITDDLDMLTSKIINFDALNTLGDNMDPQEIANDLGQSVTLNSNDILDMGNNVIITGSPSDFIQFEDAGWTKVEDPSILPEGVTPYKGYDIFLHDDGAIVQIERVIPTNLDENETT